MAPHNLSRLKNHATLGQPTFACMSLPRGEVGPRIRSHGNEAPGANCATDDWEVAFALVRWTKHRLSLDGGRQLTAEQLGCYHYALAQFLRSDPAYGRVSREDRVLWQEAILGFPGDTGLPPLPGDIATCRQVVTHGHRLRLELAAAPPDWPLSEPPTYIILTF